MTYLELVNDVLVRLREDEVGSVNANNYSKLIGKFVRDAQRKVEDAYNWNALSQTLTMETVADSFNAVLVGSGQRFRVIDAINDTSNWFLRYMPTSEMTQNFLTIDPQKGPPEYYNFNGTKRDSVSGITDTQVDVYPIPDGVYTLRFNIIQPQDPLSNDTDQLLVPEEPVILLALSKAIAERGEDAGLNSSEIYGLYLESLAEHIAIESNRYPEELVWSAY